MPDYRENDPGTEAEALSDWLEGAEEDKVDLSERRDQMAAAYQAARQTKTGSRIECPACQRELIKRSYQHVFCRSKGKGNCKDFFWNQLDDTRLARAKMFNR